MSDEPNDEYGGCGGRGGIYSSALRCVRLDCCGCTWLVYMCGPTYGSGHKWPRLRVATPPSVSVRLLSLRELVFKARKSALPPPRSVTGHALDALRGCMVVVVVVLPSLVLVSELVLSRGGGDSGVRWRSLVALVALVVLVVLVGCWCRLVQVGSRLASPRS